MGFAAAAAMARRGWAKKTPKQRREHMRRLIEGRWANLDADQRRAAMQPALTALEGKRRKIREMRELLPQPRRIPAAELDWLMR